MGKNRDHSKFPNAITVLDNGNVGIGISNPGSLLDVNGTASIRGMNSSILSLIGDDTLNSNWGITWKTTTYTGGVAAIRVARRGSTDASDMMFFVSPNGDIPNERLRITSTGNLGINTTSPIFQCDINASSYRSFRVQSNDDVVMTFGSTITSSQYWSIVATANGSGQGISNSFFIGRSTSNPSGLLTRDLIITSGGNVGIATNSPAFRLDVSDSGSVINGTATIGSNMKGIRIYNSTTATNNNAVGLWFSTGPHQAGIASFRATADTTWETSLAFYTHVNNTSNLNDATEKMRISGEGYVTIPLQPSFYATSTAGSTSYGSGEVVVFNSTRHNTGSFYNTSNGRFTAPVAGKYLFSVNVYAYGGYNNALVLTVNGSQYTVADVSPYIYVGSEVGNITDGFTIIWELAAGDYVELRCRAGNSAQIYRAHSHFAGHLLG